MAAKLPDRDLPWPICWDGVALIAQREGCRLRAYRCQAGKFTCGWGETDGVGPNTVWTQIDADRRFCDSLAERTHQVLALCTVEPGPHQLAALVSLSYNIGVPALAKSTVMRLHNAGDHAGAARAFALWNKFRNPATGRLEVSAGLTSRRAAEAALYLQPDDEAPHAMPQAVADEPRLASSPTMQTAVTVGGAGAVGVLKSLTDTADQVSGAGTALAPVWQLVTGIAEGLHVQPLTLVCAGAVAAGGLLAYRRWRQRAQGVA